MYRKLVIGLGAALSLLALTASANLTIRSIVAIGDGELAAQTAAVAATQKPPVNTGTNDIDALMVEIDRLFNAAPTDTDEDDDLELEAALGLTLESGTARNPIVIECQSKHPRIPRTLGYFKCLGNGIFPKNITSTTEAGPRINGLTLIPTSTKNLLLQERNTILNALPTALNRIRTTTSVNTAKDAFQETLRTYRPGLFRLKVGSVTHVDIGRAVANVLAKASNLIAQKIAVFKTQGKNTTKLEDLNTQIRDATNDARADLQTALTLSMGLRPDGGNQSRIDANEVTKQKIFDMRERAFQKLRTARSVTLVAARAEIQRLNDVPVPTKPGTPTATPPAGAYSSAQQVTLASASSTSIRFTRNSQNPTCGTGPVYNNRISVPQTATIRAIGCNSAGASDIWTFVYTITRPDTVAPKPSIVAPKINAVIAGTTTIDARATDNVGVARIEIKDGNSLLAFSLTSPFSYLWDTKTVANGAHTINVVASDAAGNRATSSRTVRVQNTTVSKPTVTITASDATASEAGRATGKFTLRRTRPTTTPLPVELMVSGTATRTTDYALSGRIAGNIVTIPAGWLSTVITLTPVNDTAVETAENAIFGIATSTSYTIDSAKSATVAIADNDTA